MCTGYMQMLHHFTYGTWASKDFGIHGGPGINPPKDTEGQLESTMQKSKGYKLGDIHLGKLVNTTQYLENCQYVTGHEKE